MWNWWYCDQILQIPIQGHDDLGGDQLCVSDVKQRDTWLWQGKYFMKFLCNLNTRLQDICQTGKVNFGLRSNLIPPHHGSGWPWRELGKDQWHSAEDQSYFRNRSDNLTNLLILNLSWGYNEYLQSGRSVTRRGICRNSRGCWKGGTRHQLCMWFSSIHFKLS